MSSRGVRKHGMARLPELSMMGSVEQEVSMEKRNWIIAAALATAAAAIGTPAAAGTAIGLQIGIPAPVYAQPVYAQPVYAQPVYVQTAPVAVVPAQQVWVPGHWQWQGNVHAWVAGGYVPARMYARLDRDHDRVANRWDRAPRNSYRY